MKIRPLLQMVDERGSTPAPSADAKMEPQFDMSAMIRQASPRPRDTDPDQSASSSGISG